MTVKAWMAVPLSLILSAASFWPGTAVQTDTEAEPVISDLLNAPPIVYDMSLSTVQNISAQGFLRVYDKEGDTVSIQVTRAPKKGEIRFRGQSFTYTPFQGESGKDTVRFTARDSAGNKSETGKLTFSIEKNSQSFSYADMNGNPSHYSAVKLHEQGLLTGQRLGGAYLFSPQEQVSRGDFLLYLLSASGLSDHPAACVNTRLDNDAEIPLWMKPYVKLGIAQRIIKEPYFHADEIMTRAEAVVWADRAAKMKDVKGYNLALSDVHEIPGWAVQSYLNLGAYRMLDCYDGAAHPGAALTKDVSADLIWQLYKYRQKHVDLK